MEVPLLDLRAQHAAIKDAVMLAVTSVIDRQQFIMGPRSSSWKKDRRIVAGPACHRLRQRHRCVAAPTHGTRSRREMKSSPHLHLFRHGRHGPQYRRYAGIRRYRAGTFNVSPEAIEAAITPRTRAIVVAPLRADGGHGESARRRECPRDSRDRRCRAGDRSAPED